MAIVGFISYLMSLVNSILSLNECMDDITGEDKGVLILKR